MNSQSRTRNVFAWIAVGLITFAACFWAFWGAIEAFHEGWCVPTLAGRLQQTGVYLLPATVLTGLTAICIVAPRIGSAMCILISIALASWVLADRANFGPFILATLIGVPFLFGLVFWFCRAEPKRYALALGVGLPVVVGIGCGIEPAYRVANRFDDGIRDQRLIAGNDVQLIWAPAGPGWARNGNVTWSEAKQLVSHLSEDGKTSEDSPQNFWRLPTRAEIVASLTRGNTNCGGRWNDATQAATFDQTPDKESPIWDSLAPLIYLWTSESDDADRAWIVVYHGGVHSKPKDLGATSLGFRAVKNPPE